LRVKSCIRTTIHIETNADPNAFKTINFGLSSKDIHIFFDLNALLSGIKLEECLEKFRICLQQLFVALQTMAVNVDGKIFFSVILYVKF
jgi:hypothetical protein